MPSRLRPSRALRRPRARSSPSSATWRRPWRTLRPLVPSMSSLWMRSLLLSLRLMRRLLPSSPGADGCRPDTRSASVTCPLFRMSAFASHFPHLLSYNQWNYTTETTCQACYRMATIPDTWPCISSGRRICIESMLKLEDGFPCLYASSHFRLWLVAMTRPFRCLILPSSLIHNFSHIYVKLL